MPSDRDISSGTRGASGKKKANCSFCRKSFRDVGPLVEGPEDVYICGECIELCQSILDQERRRRIELGREAGRRLGRGGAGCSRC